jgi:hypothetical protein
MDAVVEKGKHEMEDPQAAPHEGQVSPAQKRIKQLLAQRNEIQRWADYLERVSDQLIHLLPKQTVSQILESAKHQPKEKQHGTRQEPTSFRRQTPVHHQASRSA